MNSFFKSKKLSGIISNYGLVDRILLIICLVCSFSVCWFFHDKGWLRRDAGYFGYISQRMLEGDIIHRDIQVLHAGLINFLNTLFLKLSDGDLVGLRYPLIGLTVVQSAIGFKLARENGYLTAVTAVLVLTAFGFLQFINPTPNWYALCLAIVLIYLLENLDKYETRDIVLIGFVVGIIFLFRQLSGIFMALAVTVVIFLKHPSVTIGEKKPVAGRNVLIVLALGLCIYTLYLSLIHI